MRKQLGFLLAAGLVASLAAPGAAQTTTTVTHTRRIEAHYGTGRTVDTDGNVVSARIFWS